MNGSHDEEEIEWISRVVVDDDHDAFAKLVRMHQASVRRFLRRLVRDDHAYADDLAQDAFFKSYRCIGQFRGEGRFLGWLLKIAYQTYLLEQRKRRDITLVTLPEDLCDAGHWEERVVIDHTFERLLCGLKESERTALLLHYRFDLNHSEAAAVMNIPLGTVKSLIRRARGKLVELHGTAQQQGSLT